MLKNGKSVPGMSLMSDWITGSPSEKGRILDAVSPDVAMKLKRFDDLEDIMRDLDQQIRETEPTAKPAKFGQYTLPGPKEGYTEKLLTLPSKNASRIAEIDVLMNEMSSRPSAEHAAHPEWKAEWDQLARERAWLTRKQQPRFKGGHFDEPNILAHVRYDDRIDTEGKRNLFLDEVQSDWHQKGKQEGYQVAPVKELAMKADAAEDRWQTAHDAWEDAGMRAAPDPTWNALQEAEKQLDEARKAYGNVVGKGGVPDAPFKSDWHELVMKRMLRETAEKGYDRLSWTTGTQQAERYDLSRQISKVEWYPIVGSGDGRLFAFDKDGNAVMDQQLHPSQVADYIGKEPAKRLLDSPIQYSETGRKQWQSISGLDLKVGGEWAKALYDRAIPNFLNKYAKRWGAKVGTTAIPVSEPGSLRYEILDPQGNVHDAFRNEKAAEEAVGGYQEAHRGPGKWTVRDTGKTEKVWHIDITPAMKKSLLKEGQPIAKAEPWQDIATRALGEQAA
jgi:hypothetical protein